MTDDDVTVPVPGATLHSLLTDYDRLQSLAMLAVSHADARLQDIRQLTRAIRLLEQADMNDAMRVNLAAIGRALQRVESTACDDAVLIMSALRVEGRHDFPSRDPLAEPVSH